MTNKNGFVETASLNQPKGMQRPEQIKIFKYQSAYQNGQQQEEIS